MADNLSLINERNAALAENANTSRPPSDPFWTPEGPGALETAGAIFQTETVIGSMYSLQPSASVMATTDPDFNPYEYWTANKEEMADLGTHVRAGRFHTARSKTAFDHLAAKVREEKRLRKTAAEGPLSGQLLGMGLSMADIATFVPILGQYQKGRALANIGRTAISMGTIQAGQEAALHGIQNERTLGESFINIGVATALGGGISTAMHVIPGTARAARQAKTGVDNAIRAYRDNFEVGVKSADNGMEAAENLTVEAAQVGARRNHVHADDLVSDSAGAAARGADDHVAVSRSRDWMDDMSARIKNGESLSALERAGLLAAGAGSKTARFFAMNQLFGTPARRALHWSSTTMREFAAKMFDSGGVITKSMQRGQAPDRVAEDLKEFYYQNFNHLQVAHEDAVYELNVALGGSTSRTRQEFNQTKARVRNFASDLRGSQQQPVSVNEIEAWEFAEVTHRALFDEIDQSYMEALRTRFGDNAETVVQRAKRQADEIQTKSVEMEQRLIDAGVLDPSMAMGKDYRMAQLWDPKAIAQNEAEFRTFLKEVMVNDPDGDWLWETYGLSKEDFSKLGREPVNVQQSPGPGTVARGDGQKPDSDFGEVFNADQGSVLKDEILTEWQGTEVERRIQDLEDAAEAAAVKADDAKVDALTEAWQEMRERARWTKARVSEAEQAVRFKQTEMKKSQAELEKVRTEERELIMAARGARTKTVERLKAFDGEAPAKSLGRAEIEGRLHELRKRRTFLEKKIHQDELRLARIEERLATAKAEKGRAREATHEAARLKREARGERRRQGRLADRIRKKALKTSGKPPLDDTVDQVLMNMRGNKLPSGVLDRDVFESGRVKSRKLKLTSEQRRRAEEAGFLRDDLYGVLDRQYQDLSARLALQETFGTQEWKDVLTQVRGDYAAIRNRAKAAGASERQLASIDNEMRAAERDIEGLWERLLGRYGLPGDPDSGLFWALQQFRAYNFLRYGAGFLVSSTTDLANVALNTGFRNVFDRGNWQRSARIMKGLQGHEIRDFVMASERLMHNSRSFKVADVSDLANQQGVGAYGSRRHKITSMTDRAITGMSEKVNVISGMQWWNSRLKAMTMDIQLRELSRRVGDYDALLRAANAGDRTAQQKVGELASLGLGEEQMARIRTALATDGKAVTTLTDEGAIDLVALKTVDSEAYRAVFGALRRAANRSIMTPGIGDQPLLMSQGLGKTLMQFQTFGYAVVNRFIAPAAQKAWTYQDMNAVLSMGMAASLGMMVLVAKDLINRGDVRERSVKQWGYDILDRSGYLAWSTPYTNLGWRALFDEQTSRYSFYSSSWQQLLGPTGGTLTEMSLMAYSLDKGDGDMIINRGMRLLPYSNVFRAAARVGESISPDE